MEQDKKLQELLLQGSDKASMHFTGAVMKKVHHLSTPFQYQPLVGDKIRKTFVLVLAVLVASILLLCLIIASAHLSFNGWIDIRPLAAYLADISYYILSFIISFWIVFIGNAVVERKLLSSRRLSSHKN